MLSGATTANRPAEVLQERRGESYAHKQKQQAGEKTSHKQVDSTTSQVYVT